MIDWLQHWWQRGVPPFREDSMPLPQEDTEIDAQFSKLESEQEIIKTRLELLERQADLRGVLDD